ncbi:vWA domain-containing protein [Lihuaxuella thermophila]|uniref:Uncharacterized conserved protein, contains von Willebrand factor type A (VWA) domain n=1 Tax=Lihuaxuella thermophila TaxID=1173111 RepID=A0A1H8J5G3_9BACL|nr:VWA domain-containing protein [Lihuaxuella thermophila]SEN76173.1 Uncharacterized conserved protein, contains von Willebrand factor type A (vWA) domain [Lihuaxuella thermophila]
MIQTSLFPQPNLAEHLLRFCRMLRARGFSIGPGEEIDMFRALEVVDIGDKTAFAAALRLVLCSNREEQAMFDTLFDNFLFAVESNAGGRPIQTIREKGEGKRERDAKRPAGVEEESAPSDGPNSPVGKRKGTEFSPAEFNDAFSGAVGGEKEERSLPDTAIASSGNAAGPDFLEPERGKWDVPLARVARYSAVHSAKRSIARIPSDGLEEMMQAAAALVSRIRLRRSRRLQPMRKGKRLDFRRSFRNSIPSGGEMVLPSWSGRLRRQARFLLFCDGSRSMAPYAERFLQFAFALTRKASRVEVFVFSTRIRRVTDRLRMDANGRLPTLTGLGMEWDGGTRIGESLKLFLDYHGWRLLTKDTLVIIASDGLDIGDPEGLSRAMAEICRRVAGVIWLNPLLTLQGYRPEAKGMKAALPYIDTFAEACDPASFRQLAKRIHYRRGRT